MRGALDFVVWAVSVGVVAAMVLLAAHSLGLLQ